MGIPKFASLIRTKYRACWNQPGDVRYTRDSRSFTVSKENKSFRHLHIDGNSLLHSAFQFTFGYGGKAKLTPEHKKFIQTASYDEIFNQAVKNFCNSIDNMVESLQLEGDVFLVFDGPAPLAKMVQQRQRRYGKYYSVSADPSFQTALKKEMDDIISGMKRGEQPVGDEQQQDGEEIAKQIFANKVGKSSNVVIDLPPVFEDVTNRPFPNGGKYYVKELAGADSTDVLENLVAWSKSKRKRWTNILNPKAPHTIDVTFGADDKKKFLCVFHAAVYMVYKEDNPNDVLLDGLVMKPEVADEERNKYRVYFEADGFQIPSSDSIFNSQYYKLMDIFEKTREAFMRVQNSRIINAISKLTIELASQNPLFREVLIRTGDSVLRSNESNLNWLMEIRRSITIGEQQRRMFGQEEDLDTVLDKLIKPESTPVVEQEGSYDMEDIYFAENDDQTHLNSKNFDSNCLTPGTSEMKRIASIIKRHYDIRFDRKAAYGLEIDRGTYRRADGRGRKVDIYFSDSDIPGEGEQKLMQLFRDMSFREMNGKEMDLFYGLDADLFVLTVIRQGMYDKYHCGLLREEEMLRTNFMPPGPKTSMYAAKGLTYHIVDIGKLTSMIRIHPYDFAFLTFMFGNDFLPRSPIMSYETTVFEQAMKAIAEMGVPRESQLIQLNGADLQINLERLQILTGKLKGFEERSIEGLHKMYEQEKRLRESNRMKTLENLKKEMVPLKLKYDMVLRSTVVSQIWKVDGIDETVKRTNDISYVRFRSNWENHVASSFPGYNNRLTTVKKDIVNHACDEYIAGLNWIACYYFDAMGKDRNTVELPEDVQLVMNPQHAEVLQGRMIQSIAGHYETEFRVRDALDMKTIDKDMVEGIIDSARQFIRDNVSLENAASNDSKLTRRCCWDTTVFADSAVINTIQSSAYYRYAVTQGVKFMIAVDMNEEKFEGDQPVYISDNKRVPDLYYAISEMSKTNHYVVFYVLVHKNHFDDLFYEKPEIVAENEEFRLLKLSSSGNNTKRSIPTTVGKDRLSPFWYYPYLSSPLIATIHDRLASMENPQEKIDAMIRGNHIDMNSRRLESLSTVNSKVQCYAVLPPQSGSLYSGPLLDADPSTWQFPVSVTTRDYNFKSWVHEGALSVPYTDISQLAEVYNF